MGKGKESKNMNTKVKQNTVSTQNSVEKKIEEPKMDIQDFGNKKLQRQLEREQREAREEEDRKRIAADKAKQEAKKNNTKKKNKKPASNTIQVNKSKPETQIVNDEVPVKMETNENASGIWNVSNNSTNEFQNVEESNDVKQENYDMPDEPQPKRDSIKINRNFNYNYNPEDELPKQTEYNTKEDTTDDIDYFEQGSKTLDNIGNYNWEQNPSYNRTPDKRFDKQGQKQYSSNYKNKDSYSNFTNRGSNNRGSYSNFTSRGYNNRESFGQNYYSYGDKNDKQFQEFLSLANKRIPVNYRKTSEISGDLFTANSEYSLAHCVAEDMSMGAGIAKTFRSKFGRVGELLNQKQKTGGLAFLIDNERFIYYLVTKEISRGKPTLHTLWLSLNKLKEHILENNVQKLAIPQIGCGLDRLDWRTVKQMLEHIFQDVEIEIVVYIWNESLESEPSQKMLKKCAVVHSQMKLIDIDSQTGLVYFGSVDGFETEEFKSLSTKYNIADYRRHRELTQVIKTIDKGEYLYGLIIKNSYKDEPDFMVIEKCVKNLWTLLKKDKTVYIGIEAFVDEKDKYLLDKIIALMQYIFLEVDIWICWPDHLKHMCPQLKKTYY